MPLEIPVLELVAEACSLGQTVWLPRGLSSFGHVFEHWNESIILADYIYF